MKIFSLGHSNSLKCLKNNCMITSKIIIDINAKVFILKGECMNRHYVECELNNIRIYELLTAINNLSFFNNKYYKKPSEVYNNNHCYECKKIYCNIYIKNHLNEKNNNIKEECINLNTFNICQKHNKENNFFLKIVKIIYVMIVKMNMYINFIILNLI